MKNKILFIFLLSVLAVSFKNIKSSEKFNSFISNVNCRFDKCLNGLNFLQSANDFDVIIKDLNHKKVKYEKMMTELNKSLSEETDRESLDSSMLTVNDLNEHISCIDQCIKTFTNKFTLLRNNRRSQIIPEL